MQPTGTEGGETVGAISIQSEEVYQDEEDMVDSESEVANTGETRRQLPRKKRGRSRKKVPIYAASFKLDSFLSNSIQDSNIRIGNERFFQKNLEIEAEKLWDTGIKLGVTGCENKGIIIDQFLEMEKRDNSEVRLAQRGGRSEGAAEF